MDCQINLDSKALEIKKYTTEPELTFMQKIGINGVYRTFLTTEEKKTANKLVKRDYIIKGYDNKNKVFYYIDSAIYRRLF